MIGNRYVFLILFCLFSSLVLAQSRTDLERKKKNEDKKLQQTQQKIKDTNSQKEASLNKLRQLNQNIKEKNERAQRYQSEIKRLQSEINELLSIEDALKKDLDKLKKEYATQIYNSYKLSSKYSKLSFLFSSDNFYQLLNRLKYLEQYTEMRNLQKRQIQKVLDDLEIKRIIIEEKKNEHTRLLVNIKSTQKDLELTKEKATSTVKQLSTRQKQLQEDVDKRRKAVVQLNKTIKKLIEEEAKKALSNAVNNEQKSKLTNSFESRKGKMKSPIEGGFIAAKFGKYKHSVLNVILINDGISIQSRKQKSPVTVVHNGTVIRISAIAGLNNIVIVRHGNYISVYSKLGKVSVKENQNVQTGDILGYLRDDDKGIGVLEFQIYKQMQNEQRKENPALWINL